MSVVVALVVIDVVGDDDADAVDVDADDVDVGLVLLPAVHVSWHTPIVVL
jgi:hypothetical protein